MKPVRTASSAWSWSTWCRGTRRTAARASATSCSVTSHGFESLEEAADAVAAYLPHRPRPRSPEGLKKNLRHRNGRWYWHWDPAFLTKPQDDPFVRVEQLEQAAIELTIPILLIRGKLSDVVSEEAVEDFLKKVPNAEFAELSEAGHTAAGDDNDAFSEVVVQFVLR